MDNNIPDETGNKHPARLHPMFFTALTIPQPRKKMVSTHNNKLGQSPGCVNVNTKMLLGPGKKKSRYDFAAPINKLNGCSPKY